MVEYSYFFWDKFFSKIEIENLNKLYSLHNDDNFVDSGAFTAQKKLKKVSSVKGVEWQYCKELLGSIDDEVKVTNRVNHGYHLDENFSHKKVLFNTYLQEDSYDWHQDGSNSKDFDLKFTVVINSSMEDYEGGNLQVFQQGKAETIREFNQLGSVVMFKSDIPHRVTPVTKGRRNSIVYWKEGPRFI